MDRAIPELRRLWRQGRHELGRRMRRPMQGRFQPYPYTLPDRYPWLFGFAQAALRGVPGPRLLSFGCADGEEVFSLRRYFPDADLRGIEIDPRNIAICLGRLSRHPDARIGFEAAADTRTEPPEHYDAIFCLAVLCHGDLTVDGAQRSDPLMRFEDFDRTVDDFMRCLKPGGYLFLHTTNFRLCDTLVGQRFETVLEAEPAQLAADALFDRWNRLMPGERYHPVGFRKRSPPP